MERHGCGWVYAAARAAVSALLAVAPATEYVASPVEQRPCRLKCRGPIMVGEALHGRALLGRGLASENGDAALAPRRVS
jgi:hypothetical protein